MDYNKDEGGSEPERDEPLIHQKIPLELIEKILSFLPLTDLLKSTEVCLLWKSIVRDPIFWKRFYKKASNTKFWTRLHGHINGKPDEWAVHFSVCKFNQFSKNLLQNPYGLEGFNGWTIVSGEYRENNVNFNEMGWTIVENPGNRISGFPISLSSYGDNTLEEVGSSCDKSTCRPTSCFGMDAFSCSMEQQIDLWAVGFTPAVLRASLPLTISWSVFVGTPQGHEGFFELTFAMKDACMEEMSFVDLPSNSHISKNISRGCPFTELGGSYELAELDVHNIKESKQLRYVYFYIGGMAKDNDPGYNGPHVYYPSVTIHL